MTLTLVRASRCVCDAVSRARTHARTDELVRRTERYSCADIDHVCRDAYVHLRTAGTLLTEQRTRECSALMPLRARVKGLDMAAIRALTASTSGKQQLDEPLSMRDFATALAKINPSVNDNDILRHKLSARRCWCDNVHSRAHNPGSG
jgi:SpoVK/Ycf46/Vps4 family AAA+-type ATPase